MGEKLLPFYSHQAYVFTFILSILFVFGLFANGLTFVVIAKTKLRRSMFNIFLLSLCVSDFVSALFSPIFIYRRTWGYETWHIPRIFCKLFFATDQWTSVVTAAHIMLFSVLRLISVRWPHSFGKINNSHAKIAICSMWMYSLLIGFIPFFIFCGIVDKNRNAPETGNAWPACSLLITWIPSWSIYAHVAYPIVFYFPIVTVVCVSCAIAVLLWRRRKTRLQQRSYSIRGGIRQVNGQFEKRLRKDNRALTQLSFIVGSFLLGYVPHIAYHFYTTNTIHATQHMRNIDWIFGMTEYTCLRLSECMNPVIYNLSSSKIRKQTMFFLSNCGKCSQRTRQHAPRERIPRPTAEVTARKGDIPLQSTSRSSLSA